MSWPGAASRDPLEIAPDVRRARREHAIGDEALDAMVAVVVQQRLAIPALDERRFGRGHGNRAIVLARDRRVAADVIGVAMGVDEQRQRIIAESARARQQREGQRRVATIARVDQHVPVATLQKDVVRRQPVADEDVQLRRQRDAGRGDGWRRTRGISPSERAIAVPILDIMHPTSRARNPSRFVDTRRRRPANGNARDTKNLRVGFGEQAAAANHLAFPSRRRGAGPACDRESSDRLGDPRVRGR